MAIALGEKLGREMDITAAQWSGLLPGMQAGTYDFLVAPTTVTEERTKNLLFSEGYLNTDFQFAVKKGTPEIADLAGFKGKVIAVNKGSAYDKWARGLEAEVGWTVDSVPLLDIGTLEGPPETQLYRVLDAHLLPDGGVAVLNAGTAEVQFAR